jgi:tripartite-type tricarboxylate transporter receptor subunit TctC
MKRKLGIIGVIVGMLGIVGFSGLGFSQDYPTRSIELVVAFSAGGSSSMGARVVAQKASEEFGKPVIIVNKVGAGGALAGPYVAKARPDGYMLLVYNSATNGIAPVIRKNVGYKNSDFRLIAQYGMQNVLIEVKKDSPFKTIQDVIDFAKKNPGRLKCGDAGVGSTSQFSLELFKAEAGGLKIASVPFRGGAETSSALLGGHIDLAVPHSADCKAHFDAGIVRLLGVTSEERDPDFPGVPTFKEQGLPGFVIQSWYGIAAPAAVPEEIVVKLKDVFAKVIQNAEIKTMLKAIGFTPVYRDEQEFAKYSKKMEDMYIRVAQTANIKVE